MAKKCVKTQHFVLRPFTEVIYDQSLRKDMSKKGSSHNILEKLRYFDMDMGLNYNVDRCKMQVLLKLYQMMLYLQKYG